MPDVQLTSASQVATKPVGPSNAGLRDRVRSLQLPPLEQKQSWLNGTTAAVLAILALAGGGWYWWQGQPKRPAAETAPRSTAPANDSPSPPKAESPPPESSAPRPVQPPPAAAAARGGIALESKGYIIPAHRILVSPKVSGMLMSLNVEEGVRVKKGDILGEIESVEYAADLQRAEATRDLARERLRELEAGGRSEEIDRSKAELLEAQETLKRWESDWRRAQQLVQTGSVTRSEFDQTDAEYKAQQARVERLKFALILTTKPAREERLAQARAELAQSEADIAKAKWRRENCSIRSPISGTILRKNAEEGNIVNAVAFNGSYSICDIADLSDLEVELNIQERDVAKVFQGQKCKVRAEAYPDRVYEGVVSRLMPIADRAKGAVPVRVKVAVPADEEGVYLKPDMGSIVTFYSSEGK